MVAPTDDFNSYLNDLIKWNCVYTLATNGFPIKDKIKEFVVNDKKIHYMAIETDYSQSDVEQLRTRFEAFIEMIEN